DPADQVGAADVLDEVPLEGDLAATDVPGAAALRQHLVDARVGVPLDVGGFGGRPGGGDRADAGDLLCGDDRGGAAPRVPDEQLGRGAELGEELGRPDRVGDLDRDRAVAQFAPGPAHSEGVVAQHADPLGGEAAGDPER